VRRSWAELGIAKQGYVASLPTHLDSHQHLHRSQPLAGVLRERAERLGVPLRGCGQARYCGAFWGQSRDGTPHHRAITPSALAALIHELPEGATELCCHPAASVGAGWAYGLERLAELSSLCSPLVRDAVRASGVRLVGFAA
jgi:chitin disaccharide deacetylase